MNLTEFLLARIEEDEAVARAAVRWSEGATEWADDGDPDWQHIARHDPARVLAECAAKRRIVALHQLVAATDIWKDETGGLSCTVCDERADLVCGGYEQERSDGCATLRALAAVYRDHPDYDEAWAL